jgi:transposase
MAGERPLFVQAVKDQHPDKRIEVWLQDEMRFGQQGTKTTVWGLTGSRPKAVKQTAYEWCYIFGAVNPLTGNSSALVAPSVNTELMNQHLQFISEEAGPDAHVVLVLDQAGWHRSKALKIPSNMTFLPLPPYSPELNSSEKLWGFMRSHYLSNRQYRDYDHLFTMACDACREVDEQRIKSVCRTPWIERTFQ